MKTLGIHQFLPSTWLMEWLASEVIVIVVIFVIIITIIITGPSESGFKL